MCGHTDYQALTTCITRLCALSAAGLSSYVIWKLSPIWRDLRDRRWWRRRRLKASRVSATIGD